jgi:H+/Cl- antiporter ClcA
LPLVRLAGPILSFTVGGAGGIFAPALSTGACIGAGVSDLFNASGGNANLLMLAGMVGFLTGVTRTPFTAAILVLEMTDRHSIIFYLMLAALLANLASLLIDKHSFYDHLKKQYLKEVLHEDKEDVESDAKDKAVSAV